MLQSLTDLQRKMDSGRGIARPKGSKSSTRRRRRTYSGSSDSEASSKDTSSSPHKKRRRHHGDHSRDEFRKAKPPTFDGEVNTGQEDETWLLGDKEVLPSTRLFRKHEGRSFHIQSEWMRIHFVGTLQESKENQ